MSAKPVNDQELPSAPGLPQRARSPEVAGRERTRSFLSLHAPDHTRLRRLMAKAGGSREGNDDRRPVAARRRRPAAPAGRDRA
ncbi:MAG TPA: hypothetical protein VF940_04705 [Streptosporangiaceae bacterium]